MLDAHDVDSPVGMFLELRVAITAFCTYRLVEERTDGTMAVDDTKKLPKE
jgi:hypothetical protein